MKSVVIVFPGSNCDRDAEGALAAAGANPTLVWHRETDLPACDLIVLPGGFSYGDYLRSGCMAAHSPVMADVKRAAGRGVPVLGICNGFQMLTETGLLPGALLRNAALKFVCRSVGLRVERTDTPFTAAYARNQVIHVPVAHHDGNYFADDATLDRIEDEGRVAFRYCDADGGIGGDANPNGSARDIAGLYNERRTVLGMMPHPERAAEAVLGSADGRPMFDGLVAALA